MRQPLSLRSRLVISVVALVAGGLLVTDVATSAALRAYLLRRVDQQLRGGRIERRLRTAPIPVSPGVTPFLPVTPDRGQQVVGPPRADAFAEAFDADGTMLFRYASGNPDQPDPPPQLPSDLNKLVARAGDPFTAHAEGKGGLTYRVMVRPLATGGLLVVAVTLRDVQETLARLHLIELLATLAALGALGGLSYWLVRLGLRPLDEVSATADAIAEGDWSHRVQRAEPGTEVGRLGLAFNSMLGRIEEAFAERQASEDRLRRFIADASHELRTPLTSIRGYAELFRRGAADRPVDLERAMSRIEEESTRMGVLVDDLLLLARLDQGRPLRREPIDLSQLARDAADDARAVEPDRPIRCDADGAVTVEGDEHRLRQVAANLLANARVHTPPGTPVGVRVVAEDGGAVLEVSDSGPGMPPQVAARAFERFYRADPSRSRHQGGAGLGLSIVAAVAEAHGGRATVTSATGEGTTVRVELPLASDAPAPSPDAPTPSPDAPAPSPDDIATPS